MRSPRSKFLRGLSARLESDRALRERERDDAPAFTGLQRVEPPGVEHEALPEADAEHEIEAAPEPCGIQRETEQGRESSEREPEAQAVAAPQQKHRRHERVSLSGVAVNSEGNQSPHPATSWSEAGMPLRLRDAIASVRRVSHELDDEAPRDDYALHTLPLGKEIGYADFLPDDDAAFDARLRDHEPAAPDDHPAHDLWQARLGYDEARGISQIRLGDDVAHDEAPPDDERVLEPRRAWDRIRLDDEAAYQETPPDPDLVLEEDGEYDRERMRSGDGAAFRSPDHDLMLEEDGDYAREQMRPDDRAALRGPDHDLVLEEDGDYEREQMRLGDRAALRAPDHDLMLEEDGEYEREQMRLDDGAAGQEPSAGDAPISEGMRLDDDGGDEEPAPRLLEGPRERTPLRRGATGGYGVLLTAFAVAVAFVALAGFGLGLLSVSSDSGAPQDTLTATPAPSARPGAAPAEARAPAQLDELATVQVAPPPGAGLAEPPPVAGAPTSAPPLPPPPKPEFRQAAMDEAPPSAGQLTDPVDDEAAAPSDTDGTSGPFQPLFAKLPAARVTPDQVLVHYTATAAGASATAMHLVRQLKAAGFPVEARAVQFPIAANSVRYFFASDRDQAEALRARLDGQIPGGADLRVMDFTSYRPKPQQGHLEVWLRL